MNDTIKKNMLTTLAVPTQVDIQAVADLLLPSEIEGTRLKYRKGDWEDANGKLIALETHMVAHMDTFAVGHKRWENSRPTGSSMARLSAGQLPRPRHELGDLDQSKWELDDCGKPKDPWSPTATIVLVNEKTGQVFTFSTNSRGGITALLKLTKAYGRSKANPHTGQSSASALIPTSTQIGHSAG
jgi:hypothetical protein